MTLITFRKNPVSKPLRVLFVCAMNKRRSATAEQLYRNDARLEVRSGGLRADARRRVSDQDLEWADVIFVMEREHKSALRSRFSHLDLSSIEVLEVPDDYEFMDEHLQEMLRLTLDPELAELISSRE
jgi:predicted protein tyrosine phosphatase